MHGPGHSVYCDDHSESSGRLGLTVKRWDGHTRLEFQLRNVDKLPPVIPFDDDADILIVIARRNDVGAGAGPDSHISLVKRPDQVCPSPCPISSQIGICAPRSNVLHIRMPHELIQETSLHLGKRYSPSLVRTALCRTDHGLSALGSSLAEFVEAGQHISSLELETYARAFAGFVVSRYLSKGDDPKAVGGLSRRALRGRFERG